MARVLIADDEPGVASFLAESLGREHDVTCVADGAAAIAEAAEGGFDVVLTDLRMPGADGLQVVRAVRTAQPDTQVIVITAFGGVATAVEAMKLGAFDYLEKPVEGPAAVRALVARALERRRDLVGSAPPRDGAPSTSAALTWGAPSMAPVVDAIDRVARTAATVLLLGESGTGKEVVARAIHAASPRAAGPFVAINCAVLSESLLESELFGHEKGAFTGATVQRRGRIELAEGGTFFLDEIGELHPTIQAKLLRVLEERTFERLGGSRSIAADVRWIAATHRDLRARARSGEFREDLYHRLAVFPIRLPPLRERKEDLLPLAQALLARIAAGAGDRAPRALSPEAERMLLASEWPGNVRELRNVLERAVILGDGSVIQVGHIAIEASGPPSDDGARSSDAPLSVEAPSSRGAGGPLLSLEEMERRQIERALSSVGGNRREAAARLGIGLRTLYEKLKRHGLR